MGKKSKVLLFLLGIIILVSIFVTFYRTVILGDFKVIEQEEFNER